MPGIWEILGWAFYGAIRYVMFWIPLVTPFSVDIGMPSSWWRYNGWSDWEHKDDNKGGPDEHWLNSWFEMVFGEYKRLIIHEAESLVSSARQYILGLIGGIQAGVGSLGGWLQKLDDWIGGYIPDWAGTLSGGLNWLRVHLPEEIRYGWQSWTGLWASIRETVKTWARDRYDWFRGLAQWAAEWATSTGASLAVWRDQVAGWIAAFRADPYGYIVGRLGSAWFWLLGFRDRGREQVLAWLGPDIHNILTFGRDCVVFYYNLWSRGWAELGEFVDDPRAWLMDRLEKATVDRW